MTTNRMRLITPALAATLPPLGSTFEDENPTLQVRLVSDGPGMKDWSWYLTDYDPDRNLGFGLVRGEAVEGGHVHMNELDYLAAEGLANIRVDSSWTPAGWRETAAQLQPLE